MTDSKHAAARARGQAIRSERVARARKIRRRVVSGAVAVFVAAWLMIAIVLVSGHDPALASKTSSTVASTPSTTSSTVASTPSTSTTTTSSGVSSVTTSQS